MHAAFFAAFSSAATLDRANADGVRTFIFVLSFSVVGARMPGDDDGVVDAFTTCKILAIIASSCSLLPFVESGVFPLDLSIPFSILSGVCSNLFAVLAAAL